MKVDPVRFEEILVNAKPLRVEITRWRARPKGTLIGVADTFLPDLRLHIRGIGVRRFADRVWLSMPGLPFVDRKGVARSWTVVFFSQRGLQARFEAAVLDALKLKVEGFASCA